MDDLLARFEERRIAREEERQRLQRRLNELAVEGERDMIAVEQLKALLATPLDSVKPPQQQRGEVMGTIKTMSELRASSAIAAQHNSSNVMVKDMVLAVVRDAYPTGLTSQQIRGKAFLRFKQHINPNTLTVSLVRHSKGENPTVRCEGRTWFYIRPKANGVHSPNGGAHDDGEKQKSPEVPGLL